LYAPAGNRWGVFFEKIGCYVQDFDWFRKGLTKIPQHTTRSVKKSIVLAVNKERRFPFYRQSYTEMRGGEVSEAKRFPLLPLNNTIILS
jgi:hypothetical protein